jgi:hypothetical protein
MGRLAMNSNGSSTPSAEQAEAILRQRLRVYIRELRVLVHAEGVVLQGAAVSYYGKQMVQHVAHQLFRLPIVANEIEVRSVTSPPPEDGIGEPT